MYSTSTHFIKAQIPGATIRQLLLLYKRELEQRGVTGISIDRNAILFSKAARSWEFNNYYNRFAAFTKGEIRITEEGLDYVVDFRADTGRMYINPAVFAATAGLVLFMLSGFEWIMWLVGIALFLVSAVAGFINMSTTFPVYFMALRNDIESRLFAVE